MLRGNGFVVKSKPPEYLVNRGLVDPDGIMYNLQPVDHGCWTDAAAYRRIYETPKTGNADQTQAD